MKNVETITALAVALGAATLLYYYSKKGKKQKIGKVVIPEEKLGSEVVRAESEKYATGLLKEYDIVIPHAYPAKSVREKAEIVSKDRHAINPKKRAYPTFLHEF